MLSTKLISTSTLLLALAISLVAAKPRAKCTLQVQSNKGTETKDVVVNQCVDLSASAGVTQIDVKGPSGRGSAIAYSNAGCGFGIVQQGASPLKLSSPSTVKSVKISACS